MRVSISFVLVSIIFYSCTRKSEEQHTAAQQPVVRENGQRISFPEDIKMLSFFTSDTVNEENIAAKYDAPAAVAVSVTSSGGQGRNAVLFDNQDLGAAYSQFLQHLINIKTYKVNLERVKDLSEHGGATGKEVLDAETQLENEEAAITEQEAKLKIAGLDPEELKKPARQEVVVLCEVPESQIQSVQTGTPCTITFTAFPNDAVQAKVNGLGAEVDNVTRLIKVRVTLPNTQGKYQVGMFASVAFQLKESDVLSVPTSAIVNVQGKDYAFVRESRTDFIRKEVLLGQQLDDKVIVLHGLNAGDIIITGGAMELKGLSFGY
jgi:multidrug efflux pump subunit AcrA (membrane-fusion protein)